MHVFLFFCFIGLTFAAPQSYNYQSQVGSNTADNNEYTQEQYQILQQFYQQQQQQELAEQQQLQQQLQAQYQQQLQQQQQQFTTVENNVTPTQLVQEPQQQQQKQEQHQQPQQQQPLEIAAVVKEQGYQTAIPAVQTQNQVFQSQPAIAEVKVQQSIKQQASVPVSYAANTHVEQQPHSIQHSKPAAFVQSKTPNYQTVKYNKEFYFLAAPKEDDSDDVPQELQDQLNQTKKNIRVVFIKAPEQNSLTNAALQLAKQSIESQTAIYVLTKQHDVAGLATKLQEIRGSSSAKAKPEVIFIKYKTPEEAEHAQRTIQAQYEALDGPNSFNYQGVAPSHSFVDSAGVDPRKSIGKILAESAHATAPAEVERPNSQYLPAADAAKKKK